MEIETWKESGGRRWDVTQLGEAGFTGYLYHLRTWASWAFGAAVPVALGFVQTRCPSCDAPMLHRVIGFLPAKALLPPPKTTEEAARVNAADQTVRDDSLLLAAEVAARVHGDATSAALRWRNELPEQGALIKQKVRYIIQANSCTWCKRDWLIAVRLPRHQRDLALELPRGSASGLFHVFRTPPSA